MIATSGELMTGVDMTPPSGPRLVIVIVAEMFIGSTDGLGQRILKSQMVFDMPDMYASIFAAGALGYLLNLLFIVAERRFVHWGGK